MLEQNKNPISPLVAGQLPDFVKIDHPTLNSFLSAYYEWLDKDTTYLRSPKRLNEVIDIDTTMDEFVAKFKNEFLFDFPETLAELDDGTTVDASKLVKNIKSFYKAKGTEKTYDFLFRILYDTGVEFYYPKKDILKLSHGKWILKKTIKLSNFLGSTIFDSIGETVKQRNSQGEITASGRVMDATTYRVGIYEIAELSLGGINGAFDVAKGEVEFVDNYGNVRKENRIFPVIGEVTVTTAGSGYLLGDRVVLTPAAGDTGLNALGRVSEISSTGGVKKVMMYNLGVNYKVSPTISIISELGKDFSGTVSVSAQANYAGYYANSDGKLGSNKVIQDNHYYQDFSYVMLAEITIDRYRDVIKKLLNPAGMAFFGKILLKRCAAAELNHSTALAQYEVPLIGNYLPYTFITYEDLSKWFVKTTTVNGKVQTTIDGYNRNMQESVIRNDYTRDGIVDGQDYEQWSSMHPQDTSTEKQFIQKIGNPFASQNVYPGTDGNPLLRQGSTEHPFWIVYQHPNRKVADTVVARIPYDLKNDFLSNHGALALTGSENFPWNYPMPVWNPSATGVSGVLGFAASAEEPEAIPTGLVVGWGRNSSLGFSGNNQCFGTNSDGTEIYEKAGTEWNPDAAISRRSGTTGTGMYGDTVKILGNRLENVTKVMTVGSNMNGVTIALKDSGLIAWGNSDTSIMSIPVSARSDVSDFHAHTTGISTAQQIHAIKTDGRVFSWGTNAYGECGGVDAAGKKITSSTSSTGQYLKMGASDLTGAIQIVHTTTSSSINRRIYALLNTGKVVTWASKQRILGTSSTGANILTPYSDSGYTGSPYVSVMGNTLTGAIQIATGYDHAIALKSNGTVVALDAESVVPAGLTGVVSIVAKHNNSAAVLSDGTIRIWGATNAIWPTGTDYTGNNIAGPTSSTTSILAWTGNSPYKIWGETLTGISALFAPKTTVGEGNYTYLYAKKQDGRLIPIHGDIYPYGSKLGYDKFGNYSRSEIAAGGASGNTAGNLFDWYQSGGDLFPFDGRFTKASSCNGGLTSISCCGTVCVGIKDGLDSFPDITSITGATSGPFGGGTQFTVNGTEFHSDSIVKIDGVTAASATINSPTSITVTTPAAKTPGTKVVSVENVCGFAGMTAAFTYLSDIILTSVSPTYAYIDGGTSVRLNGYPGGGGTNLLGITSVIFGGVSATGLTANSSTSITVTAPAHSAGIVDVTVVSPAGTSTLTGGFEYLFKPATITTISPNSGPTPGGTTITITGTSLASTLGVSVDNNPATGIVKINDTQITAITPAGIVGAKSVVVTTSAGSVTKTGGFTYTSVVPTISGSISPNSGPTTGGTTITITGTNFVDGLTTVTVDENLATGVVFVSATSITAVTPAGTVGAKNVVVTTPGGVATKTSGFTYTSVVPTISGLTPINGPTTGGTAISIIGTLFVAGATVTVGGAAATSVVVVSSTQITAVTPAGSVGASNVVVTTSGGSVTKTGGFTYTSVVPTITTVNPNTGLTTGGTAITITGTFFVAGTTVTVGGNAATSVVVVSSTQITAVTPAGSVGASNVVVTTTNGTVTKTGGFTYLTVPLPTITNISPSSGPTYGGTAIAITGTLLSASNVYFDGLTGNVYANTATKINVTSPAHSAGVVDVVVVAGGLTATSYSGYTYVSVAPTVSAINPNFGPSIGGTPITVIGTNLTGTTSVTVGGAAATSVVVVSSTQITAVTPTGTVGARDVIVTTTNGTVTKTGGFTYIASPPTSFTITPSSGLTIGGTPIIIIGTNLTGTTSVTVGEAAATSVVVVSSTKVTAITPAGSLGARAVVVTTPEGSVTGSFTYVLGVPTISGVNPNFGPTTGGTRICIQGTNLLGTTGVTVGGTAATELLYTKTETQDNGVVLSFGRNTFGQGLGTDINGNDIVSVNEYGTNPVQLLGETVTGVTIKAADKYTLGLKNGGVVFWGSNFANANTIPETVKTNVIAISTAFESHNLALKTDGTVIAWGNNDIGQCNVPAGLTGVSHISVGGGHSLVIKNGEVLAWGKNNWGQCTVPDSAKTGVIAIACGEVHSAALKNTGEVVAWGNYFPYGQTNVPDIAKSGVIAIACGGFYTMALKNDGKIYAWGSNESGVCLGTDSLGIEISDKYPSGDAIPVNGNIAVQVGGTTLTGITDIACGRNHAVALKNGKIYAWGRNIEGQCTIPASAESGVTDIQASALHTIFSKTGLFESEALCCKTPAGAVGTTSVVVTTPQGSATGSFTYVSTLPTISSYGDAIIPNSGPTTGGTVITITGTNFLTGTTVTVGGNAAASVVVVSSTKVTAITPAGSLGAKHVTVTTSGGTATANNAFTYIDPAPVIDSSGNGVIPNKGPTTGGTPITILGNYFNGANKVTVDGKPATNVVVVSKTIITAVTPAGSQGTKDISVTTASGTGTLRNAFTYYLAIYSGPIHIEGAWPEWNESITANREYWTREFTEGHRYVSLSYNPLVPLYQDTPGSDGATGLSVYKNTTSTVYGNPTNLYDSFVVDGTDWSKEQLEALGPSFVGGKRCYKFTETELNLPTNRTTESIVNSLETWLYSQGFNRTTQEYVILKLNQENTLEMIQVLKGIKRLFPEAKFGYYDYPKIPSFVLVIEQQYNSFEYLSDASRNTIIENTTNSIYDLIKEQDLIVLDMHFSSPSLAKMKVLAAAKIKVADKLNQKLVAEGLRRKVVIAATSRIWKTNSNETPIWVRSNEPEIAQSTRDQYYIPEYSVVKPSTFINTFKDIIGIVAGESRFTGNGYRTIDGYYNDLDPQFLLQAALGSTHADYVNSIYNDVPPVLNANRSINTDSYQTLVRKSLSTYVNYSKGVTGSTEFYSATGATASNWHYDYWFPLVNKKISSIPSAYYSETKTDILYNAIYPIYYKFNYLISMAYSAAGQAIGGFNLSGNLLGSWPTSDTDSPEVTTLLGDLDGSGHVDSGDIAVILLNWGENSTLTPEYRYDAPWTKTDGEVILPTNKLLGYKIAYSDFRKITARSFFEMPVGREFNCTTDEVTAPPVPVVFAAKINGSAYPLQANYDHTDASNLVTGGENLVLHLEAERGITGTPTEGISSLVYLGYYGIRSLWAELYAVKPSEAGNAEIEYQIANAGPFKPTSPIISINTPFPNFENPNTTNEMFTANYRISDSSSFLFGGANIVKNNFFMRLKLVFRNGSNSAVPNATKVMDFNYNRT